MAVGDTVTWASVDSPDHTVTADDDSFDSGTLSNGDTFEQTFDAAARNERFLPADGPSVAKADGVKTTDAGERERLMAAEMQLELGEIDEDTFEAVQADVLARLREIRERQEGDEPATVSPQDYKITGIEASFEGDEH